MRCYFLLWLKVSHCFVNQIMDKLTCNFYLSLIKALLHISYDPYMVSRIANYGQHNIIFFNSMDHRPIPKITKKIFGRNASS